MSSPYGDVLKQPWPSGCFPTSHATPSRQSPRPLSYSQDRRTTDGQLDKPKHLPPFNTFPMATAVATKPLNVLISGSGIAGSVFVYWLLKAQPKASITIVERAPSPRLTGASVDIRSSAVDIIKWMGMEQEIRNNCTGEEGMSWVDTHGKSFATFRSTGSTDFQSMTSEYEIHRGALASIFLRPSEDKIKMIFDETVDHFSQRDDGKVDVSFTKSKDTTTYDLLVAADGLSSRIRGQMLNAKSREQIHVSHPYKTLLYIPR